MKDTSLLDDIQPVVSTWWLISILAIAGGLIGWLISLTKPPMYEARASMMILLDANKWNKVSGYQSDILPSNINALISPQVLGTGLIAEYGESCGDLAGVEMQIERRESQWSLVVRCPDAQGAADLVNGWAETALSVLAEAYDHSLNVEALAINLNILIACKDDPDAGICGEISDLDSLQGRILSLRDELEQERQASRGINPGLSFRIESYATIPAKPASNDPGALILAGMVAGLIIGILVATIRPRNRLAKRT